MIDDIDLVDGNQRLKTLLPSAQCCRRVLPGAKRRQPRRPRDSARRISRDCSMCFDESGDSAVPSGTRPPKPPPRPKAIGGRAVRRASAGGAVFQFTQDGIAHFGGGEAVGTGRCDIARSAHHWPARR